MSVTIYKIFPKDHLFTATDSQIMGSVNMLKPFVIGAEITWGKYEYPQFIDCGDMLNSIVCPHCNFLLEIGKWQEWMNKCYSESHFIDLAIKLDCCGKQSALNELIYNNDCGFAMYVIEIMNPGEYYPCGHELFEAGKVFLGKFSGYKMIVAHY